MKRITIPLFVITLTLWAAAAWAGDLPIATPESQGVSSSGILKFVHAAENDLDAIHSFVLLRHGKVIAQGWWSPFEPAAPHMLYSLSKSFTSTGIGMLVDEGKLSIDAPVLSFFPEDAPENPSAYLKAMKVRHLMTMSTGHGKDTLPPLTRGTEKNWPKVFLAQPVEFEPGTHFLYNTGATYMLSAIVQKVTGQTLIEYLTPRLFKPLGIEHPTWETDPRGVNVGGWGLKITTTDIARFGQLYLQKGLWDGQRLLCESWIAAATSAQVPNGNNPQSDWNQGYGYQFWRSRHNAFRGDGAMGQYCIVMPDQDAVLAVTSGLSDMQKVLNIVWDQLLPAFKSETLPTDEASAAALVQKLKSLSHRPVAGQATSPLAAKLNGKRFTLEPSDPAAQAVSFDFESNQPRITLHTAAGDQVFRPGYGQWTRRSVPFHKLGMAVVATTDSYAVATSGAWTRPDTYSLRAWAYETPYRLDLEFTYDSEKDQLSLKRTVHPVQPKPLTARGSLAKP